jgi:alpha-glucosidase
VEAQEADPQSTLNLYRRALAIRSELVSDEDASFPDHQDDVIEIVRNGWRSVTTFGTPAALPPGEVLVATVPPGDERVLPADATAWIRDPGRAGTGRAVPSV